MWLFLPEGFFSIVKKPNERGLQVRARSAEDLDALRERLRALKCPAIGPTIHTPDGDYHYRALISAKDWGVAMKRIGESVRYDNFKHEVLLRQGSERARLYTQVWAILRRLQDEDAGAALPLFDEDEDYDPYRWEDLLEPDENESEARYAAGRLRAPAQSVVRQSETAGRELSEARPEGDQHGGLPRGLPERP